MSLQSVYTDLPVEVARNEPEGVYEFAVYPGGVRVVFATRKLGGIDSDFVRFEEQTPVVSPPAPVAPPPGPDTPPSPPPVV